MRIIKCEKERWSPSSTTPYRIILSSNVDDEIEQLYSWCLEKFGQPQNNDNLFSIYRKWVWYSDQIDPPPYVAILSLRYNSDLTQFKLRWL